MSEYVLYIWHQSNSCANWEFYCLDIVEAETATEALEIALKQWPNQTNYKIRDIKKI